MWLLSFLSETWAHIIVTLGILLYAAAAFFGSIPIIGKYVLPVRILSIALICAGFYLEGKLHADNEWQQKVKDAELKAAKTEVQSAEVTTQIQTQVVEKTKTVREKGATLIQYIDRDVLKTEEVVKYINSCPLPPDFIEIHNKAATLE